MEGIDPAGQFLLCCSVLRKTMKWTKEVVPSLTNCGLFSSFRVYNILNPQAKMKYKQFLLSVVRDWVTDGNNEGSPEPDTHLSSPSPGVQGEHHVKIHPKGGQVI